MKKQTRWYISQPQINVILDLLKLYNENENMKYLVSYETKDFLNRYGAGFQTKMNLMKDEASLFSKESASVFIGGSND
jgi:hypothetical protein